MEVPAPAAQTPPPRFPQFPEFPGAPRSFCAEPGSVSRVDTGLTPPRCCSDKGTKNPGERGTPKCHGSWCPAQGLSPAWSTGQRPPRAWIPAQAAALWAVLPLTVGRMDRPRRGSCGVCQVQGPSRRVGGVGRWLGQYAAWASGPGFMKTGRGAGAAVAWVGARRGAAGLAPASAS